jgi:hypothetical protein
MKTAMQELIDELESIKGYKYGGLVIRLIKNKLEKEKEQIIDAWQEAYVTGCVVGSNDYTNENEETDNGAYYYDQTYNQNK